MGGHENRRSNASTGSSSAGGSAAHMTHNIGHEPRRCRRKLSVEEEETHNGSDDSEADSNWVDSNNEIANDDDDLDKEWSDPEFVKKMRNQIGN